MAVLSGICTAGVRGVKSLRAELAQANAEVAKPTIVLYDEDPR